MHITAYLAPQDATAASSSTTSSKLHCMTGDKSMLHAMRRNSQSDISTIV
jgi:hypothetical protein